MARRKPVGRKRRTRQHVIADLAVNYVERQALLCGFSVERTARDYGLDLTIYSHDLAGELENGHIRFQVKATERLKLVQEGKSVAVRIAQAHFRHWLLELWPVILVLYDAPADVAYWLYIQAHFESQRSVDLDEAGEMITVHVPRTNLLNSAAMRQFAGYRERIQSQLGGTVRHAD